MVLQRGIEAVRQNRGALARYLVVGTLTNGFWYCVYLGGSWVGIEPLVMATIAYIAGVATSYAFNRGWSFRSTRIHREAIPFYGAAYVIGYLTNMFILFILYKQLGMRHELAQLISAAIVAAQLFLLLRFWVFPAIRRRSSA